MRNLIVLSFIVVVNGCGCAQQSNNAFLSSDFKGAVETYIVENSTIPNKCKESPVYMIFFDKSEEVITFWIGAQLGVPDPIPLSEPETEPNVNQKENKGFVMLNDHPVFVFDYQNSNGYGLYDIKNLSNINSLIFNDIPDSCSHVSYPGLWIYKIENNSLILIERTESFIIK